MPAHLRFPLTLVVMITGVLSGSSLVSLRAAEDIRYIEPSDSDGSSAAVIVPDEPLVHTAQFLPLDKQQGIIGKGHPREQVETVLEWVNSALWLSNPTGNPVIIKFNVVAANLDVADEVRRTLAEKYSGHDKPAVSYVIGKLRHPDAFVAIDAVAVSPRTETRGVVTIDPKKPAGSSVLGPGPKVYVSGQAEKGKDIAEMTRRTMESL